MRDIGFEPRLDPPKPEVIAICMECGEAIYAGDEWYTIEGIDYCEECVNRFKHKLI